MGPLRGGAQRFSLGSTDDRAGEVESRSHWMLSWHSKILRRLEASRYVVDGRLQRSDHVSRNESLTGLAAVAPLRVEGQVGHQNPKVALNVDEQRVDLGTTLNTSSGQPDHRLGLIHRTVSPNDGVILGHPSAEQ